MPIIKTGGKLGEILLRAGLVTQEQLTKALEIQRGTTKRIGEVFVELGLVSELDIAMAVSKQLGIPYVTGSSGLLHPPKGQNLETLIAEPFARKYLVLPLAKNMDSLTIACVNPLDLIMIDNIRRLTGCEVNPVVTTRTDLEQAINTFYDEGSMLKEAIDQSYQMVEDGHQEEASDEVLNLNLDRLREAAEDAPVIRLVDLIIHQAIKERASDIHIEPFKDRIHLRYRIDGILYEMSPPARTLHSAIVSRIKILSKLDIAEKRLPQDGGFSMTMDGPTIDFRISTIPTIHGEKVVIRILRKTAEQLDLGQLGLEPAELEAFRQTVLSPYGLVLTTGPTGSGKTTTLYGALSEIRASTRNIITIEDPVEYRLDGVNQVQIKPSIGLTFARGLRAFLRQDPDVIMVGEIRDKETAEICVQAALTGHMVFSTVHTNDAASAAARLTEMGVPSYLVSSTLTLVVAQRLLRRLCQQCRVAYEPLPAIREQFGIKEELLYQAKGCEQCGKTGYKGRVGIFELMHMNRELRDMVGKGVSAHQLAREAEKHGMVTLWQSGLKAVRRGLTSLEELSTVVVLEQQS